MTLKLPEAEVTQWLTTAGFDTSDQNADQKKATLISWLVEQHARPELFVGRKVILRGLEARPELNGRAGLALSLDTGIPNDDVDDSAKAAAAAVASAVEADTNSGLN